MDNPASPAIIDLCATGLLRRLDDSALEDFLAEDGLHLLFFTGGQRRVRESHDVAVALREILKDYPGLIEAAVLDEGREADLQQRFRVITPPSLVFIAGGKTLEVIPGVRDWADYAEAFQRYLGAPRREASA